MLQQLFPSFLFSAFLLGFFSLFCLLCFDFIDDTLKIVHQQIIHVFVKSVAVLLT